MYKPLREMTYWENKPVIVLTDVAQINSQEVKPQHLGRLSNRYMFNSNTGCVPWFYTFWYRR